jgi:uncharacterized protein
MHNHLRPAWTVADNTAMLRIIGLSSLMAAMVSSAMAEPPEEQLAHKQAVELKGNKLLENFDYHGVTLDAGPLRKQVDEAREDYLRIPNEDLLKGFRQRAGLPAPGKDLGGWYTADIFHVFGQIVSGLSRLYAVTGDPACRDKVNTLVAEWAKCIAPDGYFFYSAKPNARHYIYDKLVGGLVDAHLYCGSPDALPALSRITDWAIKHLERSRKIADNSTEWYTLSENLYRAYLATGDEKYRDFAEVWEYSEYWNIYLRGASIFAPRPNGQRTDFYHAYSHVNTLGGAGAAYLVKGNARYLDLLRNAYDFLDANELYATGGYGPDEQLLPRPAVVARLGATVNAFETQCGTWAGFKMAKYLICCTGDAKYGDWVERLALNGVGASIPMTADGRVFYYSDYNTHGGEKRRTDFGWSCCTGTRPQAVADFADQVYFRDADSLYVDLFTPATVKWHFGGADVTIRQQTRFPDEPRTKFTVVADHPAEFAIKLRTPGWLAGPMTAELNGRPAELLHDEKGWAAIRRKWTNGDKLVVEMPMQLSARSIAESQPYPSAISYGPVVLAASAPSTSFVRKLDLGQLDRALMPVAGESLTWRLAADPAVVFRPFYAYKQGQKYFLYLDPSAGRRLLHGTLTYHEAWNNAGQFHFTNIIGATVEAAFEGTGIRWLGYKYDDAGQAEVTIDSKTVGIVDQYGPGRDLPFDWSHTGLKPGKHTIRLKLLETKDPKSKNRFINVAGFEILDGE